MNELDEWFEKQKSNEFFPWEDVDPDTIREVLQHTYWAGHSAGHLEGYLLGLDEAG